MTTDRDISKTHSKKRKTSREKENQFTVHTYVSCFRATFVKQNLQALDKHSFSSDELYLKVQSVFQILADLLNILKFMQRMNVPCSAGNVPFKVITAIFNFYIPTTCMVVLYVKIFLAIKRRSKEMEKMTASQG